MRFNDILDEGGEIIFRLSEDYPIGELAQISSGIVESAHLIPGYIPAEVGFLDIRNLIHCQFLENFETHILPDRNIVTRMAAIAKIGMPAKPSKPDRAAAKIMAMAQIVDWQIEPTIAFYELASREGSARALEELSWFRVADTAHARAWIDIALGRDTQLPDQRRKNIEVIDLNRVLPRWSRNYAICLKIATLELCDLEPLDRFEQLVNWMKRDFFIAGPALLFAAKYFSPISQRRGMLKNLRSPDRKRALLGVANAAWDVTYLSDFTKKVRENDFEKRQFVLATADESLADIARMLFLGNDSTDSMLDFVTNFSKFWPTVSATKVALQMVDALGLMKNRPAPDSLIDSINPIPQLIKNGEAFLLNWKPV